MKKVLITAAAMFGLLPAGADAQTPQTQCRQAMASFAKHEAEVRSALELWPFGRMIDSAPDIKEGSEAKMAAAKALSDLQAPLKRYLVALEDLNYEITKCAR